MNKKINSTMQTLVGVVTPYDWDENDHISQVSISATDDEEYLVENSERFISLVQKLIRATGIVTYGKKTHRMINIKKFQMLDYDTAFEQVHSEHSRAFAGPESDLINLEQPIRDIKTRRRHEKKGSRLFSSNA